MKLDQVVREFRVREFQGYRPEQRLHLGSGDRETALDWMRKVAIDQFNEDGTVYDPGKLAERAADHFEMYEIDYLSGRGKTHVVPEFLLDDADTVVNEIAKMPAPVFGESRTREQLETGGRDDEIKAWMSQYVIDAQAEDRDVAEEELAKVAADRFNLYDSDYETNASNIPEELYEWAAQAINES